MKFCTECCSKIKPSNGVYPKFCAECGHAFGVKEKKKTAIEQVEDVEEMSIQSLDFDFDSQEESVLKIENVMGSSESSNKNLNRKKSFASIDELRASMKENSIEEA